MSLIVMGAIVTLCGGSAYGEGESQPTNDLPNPYQTIAPWGDLPEEDMGSVERGRDRQRRKIRLGRKPVRRESGHPPWRIPVCVRQLRRFHRRAGHEVRFIRKTLKSFGAGLFIFPHKIYVDADGNIWVVDGRSATIGSARSIRMKSRRAISWSSSARMAGCC